MKPVKTFAKAGVWNSFLSRTWLNLCGFKPGSCTNVGGTGNVLPNAAECYPVKGSAESALGSNKFSGQEKLFC